MGGRSLEFRRSGDAGFQVIWQANDRLRPWDWVPEKGALVDDSRGEPLRPYQGQEALIQHTSTFLTSSIRS